MLLVRNIRLPLTCPDPDAEAAAKALASLRVPARRAAHCGVAKLSVDARHGTPVLVYTIAVTLKDEGEESALAGASPCVCYTQPPKFDFTTGKTPLVTACCRPTRRRSNILRKPAHWTPTPTSSLARAARAPSRTAS